MGRRDLIRTKRNSQDLPLKKIHNEQKKETTQQGMVKIPCEATKDKRREAARADMMGVR
jgi:hypothetical protein